MDKFAVKYLPSKDVPRPQDSAKECVERIMRGYNHAVVDLVEVLERDGDPRLDIVAPLLRNAMERIRAWPDEKTRASATVSIWQGLAVNCVRIMKDEKLERYAQDVKDAIRRGVAFRDNRRLEA
jgi:hypothetical protein